MFTLAQAQDRFEERYNEFRRKAGKLFADLLPEARDEAIDNVLYLTWHNFVPTIDNGKADDHLLTCTFYFACKATRSGRKMRAKKHDKSRELWCKDRVHTNVNLDAFISKYDDVFGVVAFRIDTQAWLDSLPETHRQRAVDLSDGTTPSELAERWNVSRCTVSFERKHLAESYDEFVKA